MPTILTIAALCILNSDGRLLLVRKRGTSTFMQPGGKLEPGESAASAAVRELEEELGVVVAEADLVPMGSWYGPAANEENTVIDAAVFRCPLPQPPAVAAEIEELLWLDLDTASQRTDLAPLLTQFVLPQLSSALPKPPVPGSPRAVRAAQTPVP